MISHEVATERLSVAYWDRVASLVRSGSEVFPSTGGSLFRHPNETNLGIEFLGPVDGLRVVELGCGHGSILQQLSHRISAGTGVDFSPGQLQLARELNVESKNVAFVEYDLNFGLLKSLPKTSLFFSIYGAFDFVKRPTGLLIDCWNQLPAGGCIAIMSSFLPLIEMCLELDHSSVDLVAFGTPNHSAIRVRKMDPIALAK